MNKIFLTFEAQFLLKALGPELMTLCLPYPLLVSLCSPTCCKQCPISLKSFYGCFNICWLFSQCYTAECLKSHLWHQAMVYWIWVTGNSIIIEIKYESLMRNVPANRLRGSNVSLEEKGKGTYIRSNLCTAVEVESVAQCFWMQSPYNTRPGIDLRLSMYDITTNEPYELLCWGRGIITYLRTWR